MPAAGTIWGPDVWGDDVWGAHVWGDAGETPPADDPHLVFTPPSLGFLAAFGGGNPADQDVEITNEGGGSITPALGAIVEINGSGWLDATLDGTTLTVSCTTGALAAGTYTGTVEITSTGADNSPLLLAVVFDVTGTPGTASGLGSIAGTLTRITIIA